jgi:hypothetical protein
MNDVPPKPGETWWMLEVPGTRGWVGLSPGMAIHPIFCMEPDPNAALHFESRAEASEFAHKYGMRADIVATEHLWSDGYQPAAAKAADCGQAGCSSCVTSAPPCGRQIETYECLNCQDVGCKLCGITG